ncbi:hypothetical protein CMV_010109 [Castanea mollissima]|uniref:Uncharacterized protein n=1 Tax=Castanea mollissima TaxID=60419 RepID=A0A8J4RIU5_9ROSI|nr:hypothetical protein CMV_010109 [Castanea mollissima]
MKNKFHKLRPIKQKFHKLRPTKNKIDWSTTGSETKWWHWDLASLSSFDSESRCFGWTDQTHTDQRPMPNSKQLTHTDLPLTPMPTQVRDPRPMTIAESQPSGERRDKEEKKETREERSEK